MDGKSNPLRHGLAVEWGVEWGMDWATLDAGKDSGVS